MSHDPVHHPTHYTDGGFIHSECGKPIEVIDITRSMSFTRGNAAKYTLRAGLKGDPEKRAYKEIEDLEKAIWYLEDEVKVLKAKLQAEIDKQCESAPNETVFIYDSRINVEREASRW